MADNADIAAVIVEDVVTIATIAARAPIPAGTSGECEECEWWMPRLVEGRCGFCRDGRPRPIDWEPPTPPITPEAVPPIREKPTMPAKSIQLPADAVVAIDAIESLAASEVISAGRAAARLIEQGLEPAPAADVAPTANLSPLQRAWFAHGGTLDALFEDLIARAEQPSLATELTNATARAEAAEAALERIKAALS